MLDGRSKVESKIHVVDSRFALLEFHSGSCNVQISVIRLRISFSVLSLIFFRERFYVRGK